jgi:ABC-type lipoprotein export system ATPase subunit
MQIRLHHVLPRPLTDTPINEHSIWKTNTQLDSDGYYLVQAPSGTGKTTLISLLYGLRNDYHGTIEVDGQNIQQLTIAEWTGLRRSKMAIVFQDLRLFPQLTALENIQLKNKLTDTLTEQEIQDMAAKLGVAHRLQKICGTLSLGQQQRIAIVRALAQPFQLLLLDEPFSHLDQNNCEIASELIQAHCKKHNAGIVLTSLGSTISFAFTHHLTI